MELITKRLRLRLWHDEDLPAFAALNSDPRVMQHIPKLLGLKQIVSFTVPANQRSRKVMERIGMTYSATDEFQHPLLPEGHPLRYHVLYRLARPVL